MWICVVRARYIACVTVGNTHTAVVFHFYCISVQPMFNKLCIYLSVFAIVFQVLTKFIFVMPAFLSPTSICHCFIKQCWVSLLRPSVVFLCTEVLFDWLFFMTSACAWDHVSSFTVPSWSLDSLNILSDWAHCIKGILVHKNPTRDDWNDSMFYCYSTRNTC